MVSSRKTRRRSGSLTPLPFQIFIRFFEDNIFAFVLSNDVPRTQVKTFYTAQFLKIYRFLGEAYLRTNEKNSAFGPYQTTPPSCDPQNLSTAPPALPGRTGSVARCPCNFIRVKIKSRGDKRTTLDTNLRSRICCDADTIPVWKKH